ncbi:hypothetical protein [Methylobacterium sp. OAE515]|uniref:hypothetical protein n=1 Tax=Methylobacterium sp. OAE515 TaxID=2817895 RepID=UPI001789FC2D
MNAEQTRAFAVETTAMIEVLRTTVIALTVGVMQKIPPSDREEMLAEIVRSTGDLPPDLSLATPQATAFHEAVAAAAPRHAEQLVQAVRKALG